MKGRSVKRNSLLGKVEELDELVKVIRIAVVTHDYDVSWWTVIIVSIINKVKTIEGNVKTGVHEVHWGQFCVYGWFLKRWQDSVNKKIKKISCCWGESSADCKCCEERPTGADDLRPIHTYHAVPLQCLSLIHACHAMPLPSSNGALAFMKVRMVAGNIQTASPKV